MKRKAYSSDLSDAEWTKLKPHLPLPHPRGAPRRVNLREVINALRYLARTGCQWRLLPHDLPPWELVYYYFRQWRDDGTWERLNRALRIAVRLNEGKDAEPSAAILDSQSVKATAMSDARGYDAGKKVNGIKRHLLVDTLGLVLTVVVLTANIQDREGARTLVSDKSNEITAIPELLRLLELSGCIVTIDAMGCQTQIAKTIVQPGGDYLLAVKENQRRLYQDLQDLFSDPRQTNRRDATHDYVRTVDKGHGRIEIRECWTVGPRSHRLSERTAAVAQLAHRRHVTR